MTEFGNWRNVLCGLVLVGALPSASGYAQSAGAREATADVQALNERQALRSDLQILKETLAAVQRELQDLKGLLLQARLAPAPPSRPAPPQDVVLMLDSRTPRGDPNAPLTLVEFADYQCPFCARHFQNNFHRLDEAYVQTGKLKYLAREFPLDTIHAQAFTAAEAALCAGDQHKYWEMHEVLFANPRLLGLKDLPGHAPRSGSMCRPSPGVSSAERTPRRCGAIGPRERKPA